MGKVGGRQKTQKGGNFNLLLSDVLVNRLKTNIFFITRECALKIALTRSIFPPQMHQMSFGGRVPAGPAGGAYSALPDP